MDAQMTELEGGTAEGEVGDDTKYKLRAPALLLCKLDPILRIM
jgi:hypothetical protein